MLHCAGRMRAISCRALSSLLLLVGCFRQHGVDDDPPRDAAPVAVDAALVDAGSPTVDAAPVAPDASPPGDCRPVAALAQACVEGDPAAFIEPGVRVWVDDCHCGGELRCDVESGDTIAWLEVSVCGEGICRACTEPEEVFCPLPDASIDWQLHYGGQPIFELGTQPSDGTLCQTRGSLGGGLCDFPGTDWAPDELCFPAATVDEGRRYPLSVAGEVSCVYEPGPCEVELDDATRTLFVRPRLRACDEGAPTWGCIGDSARLERTCLTPPLRAGSYTLVVDGRAVGELATGADAPGACVSL